MARRPAAARGGRHGRPAAGDRRRERAGRPVGVDRAGSGHAAARVRGSHRPPRRRGTEELAHPLAPRPGRRPRGGRRRRGGPHPELVHRDGQRVAARRVCAAGDLLPPRTGRAVGAVIPPGCRCHAVAGRCPGLRGAVGAGAGAVDAPGAAGRAHRDDRRAVRRLGGRVHVARARRPAGAPGDRDAAPGDHRAAGLARLDAWTDLLRQRAAGAQPWTDSTAPTSADVSSDRSSSDVT